ncbi:hypothetical protein [Roseibium sp. Sym1]|uniref:hypothetical protein n=1 Tax=Roseibium sp. Sym1 TaxID=3016006 RepID=UPI0022B3170E|nr:hypothetical protein [Roseibium sp. Sym1]
MIHFLNLVKAILGVTLVFGVAYAFLPAFEAIPNVPRSHDYKLLWVSAYNPVRTCLLLRGENFTGCHPTHKEEVTDNLR